MLRPLKQVARPAEATRLVRWGGDAAVVVLLVGLALALRWPALSPSSLWLDDAWKSLVVHADGLEDLRLITLTAPGFTALLWGWLALVGFSELAAQMPALLAGLAAPPLLYAGGVSLGWPRWAAGVAGLLVAVAPGHITYSTRVRQFTLEALLAVALLWLGWRLVDDPGSRRRWAAYALAAAGAMAVSSGVGPVVAGGVLAGLAAAWRRRSPLGPALTATAGLAGLSGLWWWMVIRRTLPPSLFDYWQGRFLSVGGPGEVAATFGAGGRRLLEAVSPLPWPVTLVVLVAALAVVTAAGPARALLFAGPVLVLAGLAVLRLAPWGVGRIETYLVPVAAGLVAAGLTAVGRRRPRLGAVTAAVVAVVAVAGAAAWGPVRYPQEDVRPLVARVEGQRRPGDVTVVFSATRWAYALYTSAPVEVVANPGQPNFFDPRIDGSAVEVMQPSRNDPAGYRGEVARVTAGHRRAWLVVTHWLGDKDALEGAFATAGFSRRETWEQPGARLVLWERADSG